MDILEIKDGGLLGGSFLALTLSILPPVGAFFIDLEKAALIPLSLTSF